MFFKALTDFIFGTAAQKIEDNEAHGERRSSKFHNDEFQYPKFIPETPKEMTPSKRASKKSLRRQEGVEHEEISPKSHKGSILSTPKSTPNKTPNTPRAVQLTGS